MQIKVLHIITLSTWGGAQQSCYDIVSNLDRNKFDVEVACAPGGELVDRLREQKIAIHQISSLKRNISPINDLKALFILYRLVRSKRYNIVHCHSSKAGFVGRVAAWLARTPKIYFTVHGWDFYNMEEYGRIQYVIIFLEKMVARLTEKLICVSENDKKQGLKKRITTEDKLIVIHNGIDWKPTGVHGILRKEIGANELDVIFGMVARLAYPKKPMLFLEAARQVVQARKQAKFIVIGEGPFYDECKKIIEKNYLEEYAFMLGFRKDVRRLLTDMDAFVLCSQFEGLPITVIEAMFAGLPIITTDVGGIKELVQNERNGFLIQPNRAEDLAERMIYLIDSPDERTRMSKESQKIANKSFTIDRVVYEYEMLYMEKYE